MVTPIVRTPLYLCFCFAALGTTALAQRVDITIPASHDASLYEDSLGSLSNGGGDLFLGVTGTASRRRTLIAFDVAAAVPAGARIVFAQMRLVVAQAPFSATPIDVDVHRVGAAWGEGAAVATGNGGIGTLAQPGDATWLHTAYPSSFWTNQGGDYASVLCGRFDMPVNGTFTLGTTTNMIADVQDWLDRRRPNHGWLLKTDEQAPGNARRIHSRESLATALRPTLSIGYVPAGNALSVGIGCFGSGGLPFLQTITGAPVGGTTAQLSMSQGVPATLAVTLMSYGIRAQPIDVAPGCSLFLELLPFPSFGFRVLDATGQWTDSYQIPPDPNLFGAPVAFQSVAFDSALPRGYVLSNAHLVVFQ